MKEVVIISGKGGTGKTSLTASFAALAAETLGKNPILADCDVDAPDLHLVLTPRTRFSRDFFSGEEALIHPEKCTGCGACQAACRFEAVKDAPGGVFAVDPTACEGCAVCSVVCPAGAVSLEQRHCGTWSVSGTRFGTLVHADLDIGGENSGQLVTQVRKEAQAQAEAEQADLILVDGPPGIGCAVIASLTGADGVVAVTEPTLSGRHDLERLATLIGHFHLPLGICINKWDINPEISREMEEWAQRTGAIFLGKIPWDASVTRAQADGRTVVEENTGPAAAAMKDIWNQLSFLWEPAQTRSEH